MIDTYLVDLDRALAVQVDPPGGAARSWETPVGLAYAQSDGGLYVRTAPGTTPVRIGGPGSRGEYLGTGPTDVTDLFAWRPGLSTAVGFRLTDLVAGYVAPITDLDVGAPDRLRALIVVRG